MVAYLEWLSLNSVRTRYATAWLDVIAIMAPTMTASNISSSLAPYFAACLK
jgi:hypothetical protein